MPLHNTIKMAAKLQKLFSAPVSPAKDFANALELIVKETDHSILSNNLKLYIDTGTCYWIDFIVESYLLDVCVCMCVRVCRCCVALRESQNAVAAKSAIGGFVEKIKSLDKSVSKELASYAVGKLQSRLSSFEESVSVITNILSCKRRYPTTPRLCHSYVHFSPTLPRLCYCYDS